MQCCYCQRLEAPTVQLGKSALKSSNDLGRHDACLKKERVREREDCSQVQALGCGKQTAATDPCIHIPLSHLRTNLVLFIQYTLSPMLAFIKRNFVPAMAVTIVPLGYFFGIQLREDRDSKRIKEQLQQQSEEERIAQLEKKRAALIAERNAIMERRANTDSNK